MGPRLDSRGRASRQDAQDQTGFASMGPRLDSRGRDCKLRGTEWYKMLQWGRGWTAAEGGWRAAGRM